MVGGVSSGSIVIPINASSLASKVSENKGAALNIENLPKSKVKLDSQFTGQGKGLKIDIKA